jgi:hypothetical protein
MFAFLFLCCVVLLGSGLCLGLVTRPKESSKCLNKITKLSV